MTFQRGKSILEFPNDFCVIDLETTGLDTKYDEIIELAALRVRNGVITDRFSKLVKPSEPIDEFIEELTGITNEMVADAPSIKDVLPDYISFIGDDLLVGHNVSFDIRFICAASEKLILKPFLNNYCDTMRIARIVLPELHHHRLRDLSKHYGITNEYAHRAESDCLTTLALLQKLKGTAVEQKINVKRLHTHSKLKASDLQAQTAEFDETHPVYGKLFVFTGTLEKMQRKDAMQTVLNLGGQCGDNVTKKTDYLVLGNFDYCAAVKGNKSGKQRKAEELILKGQDLTILSESAFYEMLESPVITGN